MVANNTSKTVSDDQLGKLADAMIDRAMRDPKLLEVFLKEKPGQKPLSPLEKMQKALNPSKEDKEEMDKLKAYVRGQLMAGFAEELKNNPQASQRDLCLKGAAFVADNLTSALGKDGLQSPDPTKTPSEFIMSIFQRTIDKIPALIDAPTPAFTSPVAPVPAPAPTSSAQGLGAQAPGAQAPTAPAQAPGAQAPVAPAPTSPAQALGAQAPGAQAPQAPDRTQEANQLREQLLTKGARLNEDQIKKAVELGVLKAVEVPSPVSKANNGKETITLLKVQGVTPEPSHSTFYSADGVRLTPLHKPAPSPSGTPSNANVAASGVLAVAPQSTIKGLQTMPPGQLAAAMNMLENPTSMGIKLAPPLPQPPKIAPQPGRSM